MGIIRDTWRAVLLLIVGTLLLEASSLRRPVPTPAPPTVVTQWAPQPPIVITQQPPDRPLRRVAQAFVELGESVIGVVR